MTVDNYDYITQVNHAYDTVREGRIILYPTDTVWGLGCDATNDTAVERIFSIKNRPQNKSCIILFPSLRSVLKHLAAPPDMIFDIIESYSHIPTTFVIDNAIGLAAGAINDDGSLAFRIPRHRFCLQLLKKMGVPLVSTSANVSGAATPMFYKEISAPIKNAVDYIVDPHMPDTSTHQPSNIIRINKDNTVLVLR